MNRATQGVVLLLVGGAVLRTSVTDLYLRYVREELRPFLIASGLLLVAVAVTTLWPEFVRRDPAEPADDDASRPEEPRYDGRGADGRSGEPGHGHREPLVSWLLVLPVLALLLVAPPALGSDAASRTGSALSVRADSDFPPLPEGDPVTISVLDYATRAVFEGGRSLGERRVRLSGFIVLDGTGRPHLTRMMMSCCAADARPVRVALTGEVPGGLAADSWVEVVGRYSPETTTDEINGATIPFVEVEELAEIPTPSNQYE